MIALDNEPFTIVDHIGFVRLMNLLEPCYQLPSDKYFSETLIPEMYHKVSLNVKEGVSSTFHVSLTTDVWSSVAQDSYKLNMPLHRKKILHNSKFACMQLLLMTIIQENI